MVHTEKTPLYSWYALALLMVVYVLNFLDRTIIYILFPLIKKEMEFSDTQLAVLGTTSFVIFYTVLGIPFGRMADRGSRNEDHRRRCHRLESVLSTDRVRKRILDSLLLSGDGRRWRSDARTGGDLVIVRLLPACETRNGYEHVLDGDRDRCGPRCTSSAGRWVKSTDGGPHFLSSDFRAW
jgi:hypothetical protein